MKYESSSMVQTVHCVSSNLSDKSMVYSSIENDQFSFAHGYDLLHLYYFQTINTCNNSTFVLQDGMINKVLNEYRISSLGR